MLKIGAVLRRHGSPGLALATALLLCSVAAAEAQAAERPNIIFCMTDDQGWGDTGYTGHPVIKTPVLDEMAAEGLRLDRFYAQPICSPTRGSVMTGRHPNRFQCFTWGDTLRPQEITVAEALRDAGYRTGHFGKWHLGRVTPDNPASPGGSGFDRWVSAPNFYDNNPLLSDEGEVIETDGESSMVTVEQALPFIEKALKDDEPFFAVIWFGNPHTPHQATEELRSLYPDQPKKKQNYYGEMTGIDRAMGRLRDRLRELDAKENTLLWYTSDNGPRKPGSAGELRGWKGQLWEGGIRVPTVIEWPAKIKQQRRSTAFSGTVDIYPTLLAVAGASVPNQVEPVDGVSLLPVLNGEDWSRPKPIGFWEYPEGGHGTPSDKILRARLKNQRGGDVDVPNSFPPDPGRIKKTYPLDTLPGHAAWIDGDYKLHRIANKQGENVRYRLFNLRKDPGEQNDLSDDQPQRLQRMKKDLRDWQRSVIRSANGEDYGSP